MQVLNNVALADNYTEGNTVVSLSAETISLFIFNNAATIRVFKRAVRGAQGYDVMPEQTVTPGALTIQNAVGIQIKNAAPGNVARATVVVPEFDEVNPDPTIVGFNPTTVTIDANGNIVPSVSTSYTPVWASASNPQPVIGNGQLQGRYIQIGALVHVMIAVVFGSTTTFGNGNWTFNLPIPRLVIAGLGPNGTVFAVQQGVAFHNGFWNLNDLRPSVGADLFNSYQSNVPFAWSGANGDALTLSATYLSA